jgi:hypothetical protein
MKKIISNLIFSFLIFTQSFFVQAQSQNLNLDQKLLQQEIEKNLIELQAFFKLIETNYAPLELKKQTIGLDWNKLKSYTQKFCITNVRTTRDMYFLYSAILQSFNDAHVSVTLPSTYEVLLPIQLSYVEGKYIVNWVAEPKFFLHKIKIFDGFNIDIGDELIAINNVPVEDVRKSILAFNADGNDLTNKALFARSITHIRESRGVDIIYNPILGRSKVLMTFKSIKDGSEKNVVLPLITKGTPIVSKEYGVLNSKSEIDIWVNAQLEKLQKDMNDVFIENKANPIRDLNKSFLSKGERENLKTIFEIYARFFKLIKIQADNFLDNEEDLANFISQSLESNKVVKELVKIEQSSEPFRVEIKQKGKLLELGYDKPSFKLPDSFKKIKETKLGGKATNIFAGTFKKDDKKIGLIRIPSYEPQNVLLSLFGIRSLIRKLEENTDALIIDQLDNPGGAVLYSDWIVKNLVGEYDNSKHLRFAAKPTQDFINQYVSLINLITNEVKEEILSKEIKLKLVKEAKDNFDILMSAYKNNDFLSKPISLRYVSDVIETIIDNTIQKNFLLRNYIKLKFGKSALSSKKYTKPIAMFINELDFSGGDATPAMLQDYERVKLFGVRTAGAGGSVGEYSLNVVNPIKFRLTESLMIRKDGSTIENTGVHPDFAFELNLQDYVTNFENTFDRMLKVVEENLKF